LNKIYFTKVFKGYSPEEVEAFIIKLNNDLQQKQQEFSDVTKRLNSEIVEMKKHFDEALLENEKLKEENRNLSIEKQNLQNDIKIIPEVKKEIPVKIAEYSVVQSEGEESKLRYKQLCEQMGERLLVADIRADEIIKKAQNEAEEIITHAQTDAGEVIKSLVAGANKRAESIYKIIDEYEKKQIYISAGLDQVRKHITDSIGEVEALISTK